MKMHKEYEVVHRKEYINILEQKCLTSHIVENIN